MKIIVRSRESIESQPIEPTPHVLVSIYTPGCDPAKPLPSEWRRGFIRSEFHDVTRPFTFSRPGEEDHRTIYPIRPEQAEFLWGFLKAAVDGGIQLFVIQCEAGISRSAAIAAALSKIVTGDDAYYWANYCPNETVYKTMFAAAGLPEPTIPERARGAAKDLYFPTDDHSES